MDDARFHDELRRYWDEIARGERVTPGALDPELAAAIRRLHAVPDVPPPDPIIARRRREDLMQATAVPLTLPSSADPSANGLRAPRPATARRPSAMPRPLPWRGFSALITILLLVLTAALAVIAFGWMHRIPTEHPAVLPVVLATPATPPPTVTDEATLVEVRLPPDLIPDTIYGGQNHYTIAPGSTGIWDPAQISTTCCLGPRLNYMLDGTYTIRSEGVVRVLHQDSKAWEEIAPGTEVVLQQGDALLSQMADRFESTNPGPDPVELLDGVLFAGEVGDDPIPQERSGRPAWTYHDQDITLSPQPVPSGAATLRLRQLTLANGDVLPRPEDAVVQLGVSLDPEAVVLTGSPSSQTPYALSNVGVRPVTLYVLTLQAAPAGTPGP